MQIIQESGSVVYIVIFIFNRIVWMSLLFCWIKLILKKSWIFVLLQKINLEIFVKLELSCLDLFGFHLGYKQKISFLGTLEVSGGVVVGWITD